VHLSQHRGLVVAEHAVDERAVAAALKRLDDRLILAREIDQRHGCEVWVVVRFQGRDRDAEPICDWRDDSGRPLPLSHRLVDKVASLRADSRAGHVDVAAANDKLVEANHREIADVVDEIVRTHTNRPLRFFMGDLSLNKRAIVVARRRGEHKEIE